jgi:hypothetical protein
VKCHEEEAELFSSIFGQHELCLSDLRAALRQILQQKKFSTGQACRRDQVPTTGPFLTPGCAIQARIEIVDFACAKRQKHGGLYFDNWPAAQYLADQGTRAKYVRFEDNRRSKRKRASSNKRCWKGITGLAWDAGS